MDAKRGSKGYRVMLATKIEGEVCKKKGGVWICEVPGSHITAGVGKTKDDAHVDFVEEATLMARVMPAILAKAIAGVAGA